MIFNPSIAKSPSEIKYFLCILVETESLCWLTPACPIKDQYIFALYVKACTAFQCRGRTGAASHNITLTMPYIAQPPLLITIRSGTSATHQQDFSYLIIFLSIHPFFLASLLEYIYRFHLHTCSIYHNDLSLYSFRGFWTITVFQKLFKSNRIP